MNKDSKILVTGSRGMLGSAVVDMLKNLGYTDIFAPSSSELDLRLEEKVAEFFKNNPLDYVVHLAAKVGGIAANIERPAEFLYDNLMIEANVIEAARKSNVKKLLFLGSSCVYPKNCSQPMKEEDLLSGKLEPTNEAYALAKISGLKLCEYYNRQYGANFICLMPCNLYGINDNFDLKNAHVVSSLIRKFHEARAKNAHFLDIWGTGNARREFLYAEDAADAIVYFMRKYDAKDLPSFVNIGYGSDVSIRELALIIKDISGYRGELKFNAIKPEGMARKLLDTTKAENLGWRAKTDLKTGLEKTYKWYDSKF